ncbi:MAG: nuclear transport factor 2 family protein [Alphaproteobacteria bacterium]|jgi:hypothetical protein
MTISEEAAAKLFTDFSRGFGKKDVTLVAPTLAESFEWHQPTGDVFVGKQASLDAMTARWSGAGGGPVFSNSTFEVRGDRIIQSYDVAVTGADGVAKQVRGLDVYRIEDGLFARKDAFWKQLG